MRPTTPRRLCCLLTAFWACDTARCAASPYKRSGSTSSADHSLDVLSNVLPHVILCAATYKGHAASETQEYDDQGFTEVVEGLGLTEVLGQRLVNVNESSRGFRRRDGYNCEGLPAVNAWAYVVAFKQRPRTAAFTFRGTVDEANLQTDECLRLVPYAPPPRPQGAGGGQPPAAAPRGALREGPEVHKGVQHAFNALVRPGAGESLQAAWHALSGGKTPDRVICTGHSLGGAMANLCGVWARREYPQAIVEVTAVGSLGSGNPAWAQLFALSVDSSWQLMDNDDPVPDILPPKLPNAPAGYAKLPNLLWLRRSGGFPLAPQGEGTYEALLGDRPGPAKQYNTSEDHDILRYIAALRYVIAAPPRGSQEGRLGEGPMLTPPGDAAAMLRRVAADLRLV